MPQEVIEKKTEEGRSGPGDNNQNYRVVLINDDHNTFEHVTECLQKIIPGMSHVLAQKLTVDAHENGSAVVWTGPKEIAEMYYDALRGEGLTATLEPDS
jgi:ATP-dependent Clp protease adaptor protein ClpS